MPGFRLTFRESRDKPRRMTEDHLKAFLEASGAEQNDEGWWEAKHGRHLTFYAAASGTGLTVSRVEAVKKDGEVLRARTMRGEEYFLDFDGVYAGAVEAPPAGSRKAGFV